MSVKSQHHFFLPCKFRFDASLEYEISMELIEYYQSLIQKTTGKPMTLLSRDAKSDKKAKEPHRTIPIQRYSIDEHPSVLSKAFATKTKELDGLVAANGIMNVTILIDISKNSKGGKSLLNLFKEQLIPFLEPLVAERFNFTYPVYYIITESLDDAKRVYKDIDENDEESYNHYFVTSEYYEVLSKYIENGSVCMVGLNNGAPVYSWLKEEFKAVPDFAATEDLLRRDTLDAFKYKLIKRVGHFKRMNDEIHIGCQQYFYDGRYCGNEIHEMIIEFVLDGVKKTKYCNPKYVVSEAKDSPWLTETVAKSCTDLLTLKSKPEHNDLKLENFFDLNLLQEELDIDIYDDSECEILFIVDFIHSGKEFRKYYTDKVLQYFPNASVKGLTVICSNNFTKSHQPLGEDWPTLKMLDDVTIPIRYFHLVDHQVFDLRGLPFCPMCKYDLLDFNDSRTEEPTKLSAYQLWLICNKAGYRKEFVPTTENRKLPWLPDMMCIISENGPYLASKMHENLNLAYSEICKDKPDIVVYPDERTNVYLKKALNVNSIKLEDTPSGYFAKCIQQLLPYDIFGIPREVIHALIGEGDYRHKDNGGTKKPISLDEIPTEFPDFFERLEKLPDNLVIVDEFYSSGTSFEVMMSILTRFGKKPKCYFPVFNFGFDKMISNKENPEKKEYNNIKFLNLYHLNANPLHHG